MSAEEDENMSSDDENDSKNEEEITQLKVDLQADPFLYDKYVRLIELLSQAGELEDLRRIRETFAKYYPLSAELWLAWLADEQRLASSLEEKAQVNDLFEKATQDYNSVKVWYEFCQFSLWKLGQGSPEDMSSAVQSIRNIFERAVVAAGVNAAQGNLIWETYREFENSLLSMNRSQEQVSKVERLFKRQLAVPLLGMEQTLAEYQEWLAQRSQDLDPNVLRTYKSALELLRPRESLEDRLADLQQNDHDQQEDKKENKLKRQESLYQVYEEYIALELKEGNPVRIQNIYERRINDHCLEADAWIQYVSYLENNLKDHQAAKQVLMRATRNCPWSGVIWIKLLRSCERLKCPSEDVVKVMEDALQSGLASAQDYTNVWLAFIDYRRRQLKDESEEEYDKMREVFQRALEQLASMIDGDPDCKVARYWASLEADHFGSMDRARRIWGEILSGPISDQGQFWLEYITLEKMFGDTKHLKKLLPRAFQKTVDSPRLIGEVWLQFEREEGTLESYEDVEEIVFNRWQSIQDDKVKEKVETPKKEAVANRKPSRKRKNNADETTEQPAFKKPMVPKKDKKNESSAKKEDSSTQNSCVKPPPGFKRDVQPPPGFKSDPVMPSPPPGFKPDVQQPQEEGQIKASGQNTIFLSNLDFAVNEEKIKEVMSSSGEVLDVRLVKNYSGKSKGFAYVHFGTSEAVRGALQRDNEALEGRPMFISEYDTDKKNKGHTFKYSNNMEQNKVFVKNLPASASKEVVAKLFSVYGNLKDIRIVTYRNGHSKGIAYVDFEKAADAAKAILQLDNKDIEGNIISVAISNPPPRKEANLTKSLGGGDKDAFLGSRGRGRTQLSFVPSSLQKNRQESSSSSKQEKTNGSNNDKMSNSDFRSMLLGGK